MLRTRRRSRGPRRHWSRCARRFTTACGTTSACCAAATLDGLASTLSLTGVDGSDRAFNLAWHDWLNLKSLVDVSRAITHAALAREDSRGAHFREDFPAPGDAHASRFVTVRQGAGGALLLAQEPVRFTRVVPGQSRLHDAAPMTSA